MVGIWIFKNIIWQNMWIMQDDFQYDLNVTNVKCVMSPAQPSATLPHPPSFQVGIVGHGQGWNHFGWPVQLPSNQTNQKANNQKEKNIKQKTPKTIQFHFWKDCICKICESCKMIFNMIWMSQMWCPLSSPLPPPPWVFQVGIVGHGWNHFGWPVQLPSNQTNQKANNQCQPVKSPKRKKKISNKKNQKQCNFIFWKTRKWNASEVGYVNRCFFVASPKINTKTKNKCSTTPKSQISKVD